MLSTFLTVTGVVLILGAPILVISWRRKRTKTMRNFLIGGATVALMCAVLAAVSQRQMAQCEAAGNPDCIDPGAAGLQLLFIANYLLVAWIAAILMYRDAR